MLDLKQSGVGTSKEVLDQPYPGLRSFTQIEAPLFFGRELQVRQLRDILTDRNLVVVLGGSGSGKSSLVRAGLLPKLNSTAPIPKRSGAWYVVEFRPRTDPASELFEAIYSQIFRPLLAIEAIAAPTRVEGRDFESERRIRYRAISDALKLEPPLEVHEDAEKRCKDELRKALFVGGRLEIEALFEFADETIPALDEALATGPRSGRANLLLLIDQLEEVFSLPSNNADAGLELVMSLVTTIQTYRPFNLFLIATMRNEWLHRCSEFPGVAEAMNGSTYLVDLLTGVEVEKIVVEPARAVLRSAELDAGSAERGPYASETLRRLREAFENQGAVAHVPDQLPLLQHLLPLLWKQASLQWKRSSRSLSIEPRHLEMVLGWDSAAPLAGCLNAHAEQVLERAIDAAMSSWPDLEEREARQLLRVAFSSLAILDDHGIVRRRFATLQEMVTASGVAERHTDKRIEIENALVHALEQFRLATLIDCSRTPDGVSVYDINHEALVRNWRTYAKWVEQARDVRSRLADLDRQSLVVTRQDGTAWPGRWIPAVDEILSASSLRSAAQEVGSETSQTLIEDVFGKESTFSRLWARAQLMNGADPEGRREQIQKKVQDAELFRNRVWNRYRLIVVLGAIIGLFTGVLLGLEGFSRYQRHKLLGLFKELTLIEDAGIDSPNVALRKVLEKERDPAFPDDLRMTLLQAEFRYDQKLRPLVSSSAWLRAGGLARDNNTKNDPVQKATCIDAQAKKTLPIRDDIEWRNTDQRWFPMVQGSDSSDEIAVSSVLGPGGEDWPAGSVICGSPDGQWQMLWFAKEQGNDIGRLEADGQPVIRNIRLIKLASGPKKLLVQIGPFRPIKDIPSIDFYPRSLHNEFSRISRRIGSAGADDTVQFIESDHRVGFVFNTGNESVTLWTVAGFNEPVEDANPQRPLISCARQPDGCEFIFGNQYLVRVRLKKLAGVPSCDIDGVVCAMDVSVFRILATAQERPLLIRIENQLSVPIRGGSISKDNLWLEDASHKIWRYVIGFDKLLDAQEEYAPLRVSPTSR